MTTQEDRERALERVYDAAGFHAEHLGDDVLRADLEALVTCTVIDKDELARYKRATWCLMLRAGYGTYSPPIQWGEMLEMGFVQHDKETGFGGFAWTPAAHDFARAMQAEEEGK